MRGYLTQRRALAIVIALLLLSCIATSRWSIAIASIPATVVQTIAVPLEWPLSRMGMALRGPGSGTPRMDLSEPELRTQVGEALVYIRQLEERLRAAEERLALLTQSQEIALAGATDVEARVTGVAGDPTRATLLIDKGTNRGITIDAPVVSGVSLVGQVKEASAANARVELITAADALIFVRIGPPRAQSGPREIREQLQRSSRGPWFEAQVEINAPIAVGDWAQLADDLWPTEAQGFVVGQVTKIEEDPRNPLQFKRAIIEPMQPLSRLRRVIVRVPVR